MKKIIFIMTEGEEKSFIVPSEDSSFSMRKNTILLGLNNVISTWSIKTTDMSNMSLENFTNEIADMISDGNKIEKIKLIFDDVEYAYFAEEIYSIKYYVNYNSGTAIPNLELSIQLK